VRTEQIVEGHLQELRRGTIVLASLQLLRQPGYGYRLLETLDAAGFGVDANTLYPLLRRLEKQGLLTSEWNTDEARPRKYYQTSTEGARLAGALSADWARLAQAIGALDVQSGSDRHDDNARNDDRSLRLGSAQGRSGGTAV
jgi:PadR family transcriptional regulator, regulatory protein PadR